MGRFSDARNMTNDPPSQAHKVEVPGGVIHAEVVGDGPDLLLVPGLGGRAQFWDAQIPALSRRYRVIRHDHRGVGRSLPASPARSIAEMANDVLALMDALGIARAHYVGHSTGGAIGQHLALNAKERIDALVLSATWPGPDPLFTSQMLTRKEILRAAGPAVYLMIGTLLATPGAILQRTFVDSQRFLADRLSAFPGVETECIRIDAVIAHDLRARLSEITHRTLVIGAEDDQITPAGFFRELAALIPGAELRVLATGGHFCPMTVPEPYTEALLAFLDEASQGGKHG